EFGNKSQGLVSQSELIESAPGTVLSDINSTNTTKSNFKEHNIDPSLNYKRTFSNEDQELEIAANGSFGKNKRTAGNDQHLLPQDSLIYGTRSTNPAHENEYETTFDYVQPFQKDIKLGVGGKFSGYDISSLSDVSVWQSFSKNYVYDSSLSN